MDFGYSNKQEKIVNVREAITLKEKCDKYKNKLDKALNKLNLNLMYLIIYKYIYF